MQLSRLTVKRELAGLLFLLYSQAMYVLGQRFPWSFFHWKYFVKTSLWIATSITDSNKVGKSLFNVMHYKQLTSLQFYWCLRYKISEISVRFRVFFLIDLAKMRRLIASPYPVCLEKPTKLCQMSLLMLLKNIETSEQTIPLLGRNDRGF